MKTDLPTPQDMLEELADRATATIERNATVAFDRALEEMTDYHRFLLALSAPGPGSDFSLAEVGGFMPPHFDWTTRYRRLHERASERIPDDTHYIRQLAYAPLRLIPSSREERLSPGVMNGILDLGPSLVHRLEAWFTRRTVVAEDGEAPARRVLLAGSDERAYADALTDVVGGWEALHQHVPGLFGWKSAGSQPAAAEWDELRDTWSYLSHHLKNTARAVAISVWNEDEQGAKMFCESLLRWPSALAYELGDGSSLFYRRMLYPDIVELDWKSACTRIMSVRDDFDRDPSPRELLASLLQSVHDDVTLITSSLLLHWSASGRQQTDIAARMAMALFGGAESDLEDLYHEPISLEFGPLCLKLLRLRLAGTTYGNRGYGKELDGLVRSMDQMTERLIVPGRSFTPSTLHGRDELLPSFLALLALDRRPADGVIERRLAELVRNDKALPEGLESVVEILDELRRVLRGLENPSDRLHAALRIAVPDEPVEDVVDRLRTKIEPTVAAVQAARDDHIRAADADTGRLDPVRGAIEAGLLSLPRGLLFGEVAVAVASEGDGQARDVKIPNLSKAWFIGPFLAMPSNFDRAASEHVRLGAEAAVRRDFYQRRRHPYAPTSFPNEPAFWMDVGDLGRYVGPDPVLMVSDDVASMLREMLSKGVAESAGLKVERKPRTDTWPGYIATVHEVDVYAARMPERTAWLFSSRILERIRYVASDDGHFITLCIEWHEDGLEGDLHAHFQQIVSWTEHPIIEVRVPDSSTTLARDVIVPRLRLRGNKDTDATGDAE